MPAKNVVMFTIDDMRSVEDWGNFAPMVVTPNIDRLMDAGTTFDRAVAQVPLCNPSRSSVFTGRQPSATGIIDNDIPWYERNAAADTLPAVLRQSGAYVAMYGKNFHDDPISAANKKILFDDFLWPATDDRAAQVPHDDVWHTSPFKSGHYTGPDNLRDAQTTALAVDFLANEAAGLAQAFYLGVGITRPHLNWVVPTAYWNLYGSDEIRAVLGRSLADGTIIPAVDEYMDVPPMNRPDTVASAIAADMDLWVDYLHGYLASVSYADAKIGQVLDALEADPKLAAETSIVLWSDNGFHLGDEQRWQKNTPWRSAAEVPVVIVEPDGIGGRHAQSVVNLVDLYPTVLDLMGIDKPKGLTLDIVAYGSVEYSEPRLHIAGDAANRRCQASDTAERFSLVFNPDGQDAESLIASQSLLCYADDRPSCKKAMPLVAQLKAKLAAKQAQGAPPSPLAPGG